MTKTILIVGFGPGISTAVAERFGAAGYAVAVVARDPARLAAGVEALKAKGIAAGAFPADAGDPAAVAAAVAKAREALGPIGVVHWNAFHAAHIADLATTDPAAVRGVFDVAVVGLLAAVQAALPDLAAVGDGAVLVTNGAFGEAKPVMDDLAIRLNSEALALANGAKHKLVGLLAARLRREGVHVGEVMVAGAIRGTPFDTGGPAIAASAVADAFWNLFKGRNEIRARVS
jgi:NAD(P)-dependent dehydrogenase (short-subunit alcohol dehydrogenase family)